MAPQYEFRLSPMSNARSRAGAPGEIHSTHNLPIDGDTHHILFIFRDGIPSFKPSNSVSQHPMPDGTKGRFGAFAIHVATSIEDKLTWVQSCKEHD